MDTAQEESASFLSGIYTYFVSLPNDTSAEIGAILLGSIVGGLLAAGAGVLLDRRRELRQQERGRKLLITAICDDLQHSVEIYDRIQNDWLEQKIVHFSLLNELKESRQAYHNNKDWIVIFENSELRREIFEYYLQSSQSINSLEYNQNRKYSIENKYDEIRTKVELENQSLNEEEVNKITLQLMKKEQNEYRMINPFISDQISKLFNYKDKAKSLIQKLQN